VLGGALLLRVSLVQAQSLPCPPAMAAQDKGAATKCGASVGFGGPPGVEIRAREVENVLAHPADLIPNQTHNRLIQCLGHDPIHGDGDNHLALGRARQPPGDTGCMLP
jgi:hypothetical protein